MRLPAHTDLGDPELEGRPPQVHYGRRLHVSQPSPHAQDGNKDVRSVVGFHWNLDDWHSSGKLLYTGLSHAFALHSDKCRGLPERHPYLELRCLPRLIALLFWKHINAVGVRHIEPPLPAPCHPGVPVAYRDVAVIVRSTRLNDHVAGHGRLRLADHDTLLIRDTLAGGPDSLRLGHVLEGVEPAYEPLAVRIGHSLEELGGHFLVSNRLSSDIGHGEVELEGVL